MQAIETKWLPATNTKPFRIKATCARGSLIVSDSQLPGELDPGAPTHAYVARQLCTKFVLEDRRKYGPKSKSAWTKSFITGQLKNQSYVHVFAE